MVYCEIVDPTPDDYGKKIIRIPQEVLEILRIDVGAIIEIIVKEKRVGCIAKIDKDLSLVQSITPEELDILNEGNDYDKYFADAPKPYGLDYKGKTQLSAENLFYVRLDGEIRSSLDLSIGDIIEVDVTFPPPLAERVFINLFYSDPTTLSFEESEFLLNLLYKNWTDKPISAGLQTSVNLGLKEEKIFIQATIPDGIVKITRNTAIEINDILISKQKKFSDVTYDSIGGLNQAIHQFRKLVDLPFKKPDLFASLNIKPPRGILLTGPSGVGKSLLINALVNESGLQLVTLPPNLFSGIGTTEQNIRNFFFDLAESSKTLVLMDNLEMIVPAPYINQPEFERRFTIQFALAMESLKQTGIIIIGTCQSADKVHPMMRRSGRFELEIELTMPNEKERLEILKIILRSVPLKDDITSTELEKYARKMIGFTGSDINLLVKEAGLQTITRNSQLFLNFRQIPPSILMNVKVSKEDFEKAFTYLDPSGLKLLQSKGEKPNVQWDEIGGLDEVKQILQEHIEWQFKFPEVFDQMGIEFPKGILLYGPPGNGKTLVAKAIASQINANFLSVKGPELFSMWFSDSARLIRDLFQRARKLSPAIIFFDELDAIAPKRGADDTDVGKEVDATVNQLLTLLDGVERFHGVFIVGATNRPSALDPALLRPGRLDRLVYIPMPTKDSRKSILKIHTKKIPMEKSEEFLENLAKKTENYSGADLENLCREAVIASLREDINQRHVNEKHFDEAFKVVLPSVDSKVKEYYDSFSAKVGGVQEINIQKNFEYK
jgi:transitional endoplasmic reticulum ATPase